VDYRQWLEISDIERDALYHALEWIGEKERENIEED